MSENEGQAVVEKKVAASDWTLAGRVQMEWGKPLAYRAGEFHSFSPTQGWTNASALISTKASRIKGKSARRNVLEILADKLAIPTGHAREAVYFEFGSAGWVPLELGSNQVLFTDFIQDVVTGEQEPLGNRIVYGPLISLPFKSEDDEPEEGLGYQADDEQGYAKELADMLKERVAPAELDHFQEVMSTILQPHVPLRGQIVLYGLPYTGKTTLATAIACCPGGRNGLSQIQEASLVRDKFASNILVDKFANVSDDSPVTQLWCSFLKQYTSGNITIEPKFCKPMSVTPTAKLISTCNEVQALVDASGAGTDRLFLFKFDRPMNKVHGTTNDLKMTASYWSHPGRRRAVLSWLLEGLTRLRKRGRFDPPAEWLANLEEAKHDADPIHELFKNTFEITDNEEDRLSTQEIVEALGWKHVGNVYSKIRAYMKVVFPKAEVSQFRRGDKIFRGYKNLKIAL